MPQFYKPLRDRNLFDPKSSESFKLSRSKIDSFLNCPRCFYLDRRLGLSQPPGFPFNLNSAVDTLLKKEFDIYRHGQSVPPLLAEQGLDLIPFQHPNLEEWRENFKGLQYTDPKTNLTITGAIDDLWVDKDGTLYVADYKATSKEGDLNLDADWQIAYKRQMEVYQWLLRCLGFPVSNLGYFVYCNGLIDREAFNARLDFSIKIIAYQGDDSWVDQTVAEAHQCLMSENIPDSGIDCDYCAYLKALDSIKPKQSGQASLFN